MCLSHSFYFENNIRENHVFHVHHNLGNSVKYCPHNARKGVSKIVVFKIFALGAFLRISLPWDGHAYKSYEAPGTRPPQYFMKCPPLIPYHAISYNTYLYHVYYTKLNHTTMPCHATPYHTMPYHTTTQHAISYNTYLYHVYYTKLNHTTMPYHTMPCHAIPYHTIPYHIYYTIPHHTMPCHAIPYHTIYTIPYHIHHTIPYMLYHTIYTIPYHIYHTISYMPYIPYHDPTYAPGERSSFYGKTTSFAILCFRELLLSRTFASKLIIQCLQYNITGNLIGKFLLALVRQLRKKV